MRVRVSAFFIFFFFFAMHICARSSVGELQASTTHSPPVAFRPCVFVQEKDVRVVNECAGDAQALPFAARNPACHRRR